MHRGALHAIETIVLLSVLLLHIVDGLHIASHEDLTYRTVLQVSAQTIAAHLIIEVNAIDMLYGQRFAQDIHAVKLLATEIEVGDVSR